MRYASPIQFNESGIGRDSAGHKWVENGRLVCPDHGCRLKASVAEVAGEMVRRSIISLDDIVRSSQPQAQVELSLEGIFKIQIERFIKLGFHEELKMRPKEYRISIPNLDPQPEQFAGRFDIPLLVDPRLSLEKQLELAGIKNWLNLNKVENFGKIVTPKNPHWIWIQSGKRNCNKSPNVCRGGFARDERGLVIVEGMAFYIQHPEIWEDHNVDLAGSRYGFVRVPCLAVWAEGPGLTYNWSSSALSRFGSASCGSIGS